MSGVLVDSTAKGHPWEQPPVLDAAQQTVVDQLILRQRPLVGGVKIVGPIWGPVRRRLKGVAVLARFASRAPPNRPL